MDNDYFISNDKGMQWHGIPPNCSNELHREDGGPVEDIAVAGDGSWVVLCPDFFVMSTGMDSRLLEHLAQFYNKQRQQVNQQIQEICKYGLQEE